MPYPRLVNTGNASLVGNIGDAISGLLAGKNATERENESEANRLALLVKQIDQARQGQAEQGRHNLAMEDIQSKAEAARSATEAGTLKNQTDAAQRLARLDAEKEASKPGLSTIYQQLYNSAPPETLTVDQLQTMIASKQQENARKAEIGASTKNNRDLQLLLEENAAGKNASNEYYQYINSADRLFKDMSNPLLIMNAQRGDPVAQRTLQQAQDQYAGIQSMMELKAGEAMQHMRNSAKLMGQQGLPQSGMEGLLQKQLPWSMLTPDQQNQVSNLLRTQIQAGHVDPMLRHRGVPIDNIAGETGKIVDPSGAVKDKNSVAAPNASPGVAAPSATPAGGILDMMNNMNKPGNQGSPFPPPAATPPVSPLTLQPKTGEAPPVPPGISGLTAPTIGSASPTSAAPNIVPGGLSGPAALQSAKSLPDALTAARQLISGGADFNAVMGMVPDQFKSMVSAQIPNRIQK